ncbi:hypothetical protein FKM82_001396 [Ascaphus truei]
MISLLPDHTPLPSPPPYLCLCVSSTNTESLQPTPRCQRSPSARSGVPVRATEGPARKKITSSQMNKPVTFHRVGADCIARQRLKQ